MLQYYPLLVNSIFQEEYEYEDEEAENDSEEDPKVIKELLDLIKKAGRYLNDITVFVFSHKDTYHRIIYKTSSFDWVKIILMLFFFFLGGIEELEKQLKLQETATTSASAPNQSPTTPTILTRSLYERVLNRATSKGKTNLSIK